jgi:hypothetical protein
MSGYRCLHKVRQSNFTSPLWWSTRWGDFFFLHELDEDRRESSCFVQFSALSPPGGPHMNCTFNPFEWIQTCQFRIPSLVDAASPPAHYSVMVMDCTRYKYEQMRTKPTCGCRSVAGVMVSIVAFQAVDPGSIPGRRTFTFVWTWQRLVMGV